MDSNILEEPLESSARSSSRRDYEYSDRAVDGSRASRVRKTYPPSARNRPGYPRLLSIKSPLGLWLSDAAGQPNV